MVELGSLGEERQRIPGTRKVFGRISLLPGFRGLLRETQASSRSLKSTEVLWGLMDWRFV